MSCFACLRFDWDLGTLPVNVRANRKPSLSSMRQCRKVESKGSSFFADKPTVNIGLSLVSIILPPICVRRALHPLVYCFVRITPIPIVLRTRSGYFSRAFSASFFVLNGLDNGVNSRPTYSKSNQRSTILDISDL